MKCISENQKQHTRNNIGTIMAYGTHKFRPQY